MKRFSCRSVLPVMLAVLLLIPALAHADAASDRVAAMKAVQRHLVLHERAERVEKMQRLRKALRRKSARRTGVALRPPRSEREALPRPATPAEPAAVSGVVSDVQVNDRAGDAPSAAQSETSVARSGSIVMVGWNDGQGFADGTGNTQGYGYSMDGGQTFTDGGAPPEGAGNWVWTSDPVFVANERSGEFFYCGMFDDGTRNGVATVRFTSNGSVMVPEAPRIAASVLNTSGQVIDKPWLAADSSGGGATRLYVTYTLFTASSNQINAARSLDGGATWSTPIKLSSAADDGRVQGSRVVTGPAGQVYATWIAIGTGTDGRDHLRFRRSLDQGAGYGSETTPASIFNNFGSGAPGFNREFGFAFPSLAALRTPGGQRLHLAWNESLNFYDDDLGSIGPLAESESNNTSGTADVFTVGHELQGNLQSGDDQDWWRFIGNAGQTVIAFVSALDPTLDISLRLFCADGTSRLAFSAPGAGQNNLIVFTLPSTGTYYLRPGLFAGSGSYTLQTGFAGGAAVRGRDHRDVFVATSNDGGLSWGAPVLASDSPVGFDDWLPEIAVAANGTAYVAWYDWRTAACGHLSQPRLTSSVSGASFGVSEALSSTTTDWTTVSSNLAPNQGDYIAIGASGLFLDVAWADGRTGDPDTRLATRQTGRAVLLTSVVREPEVVTLSFQTLPDVFAVTLQRRAPGDPPASYVDLETLVPNASGVVTFADTTVDQGETWVYRARFDTGTGPLGVSEEIVVGPAAMPFSIDAVGPNPAAREIFVRYRLASSAPATLELLDLAGRRLRSIGVAGGTGAHVSPDLRSGLEIEPGLYFVRLTQDGRSATARVTVTGTR
jgi:hypothetical protein